MLLHKDRSMLTQTTAEDNHAECPGNIALVVEKNINHEEVKYAP